MCGSSFPLTCDSRAGFHDGKKCWGVASDSNTNALDSSAPYIIKDPKPVLLSLTM